MSIEEFKKEVSEKFKIPAAEVEELSKQTLENVSKRFAHLEGDALLKKQIGVLTRFFRNFNKQKAVQYDFLPILDGGVQWRNRSRITAILDKYRKDPMAAEELLNSGDVVLVGGKPVAYDTNKTYRSGATNRNLGKPLVESKFRIITVEFTDEEGQQLLGEISLNSEDTAVPITLFNPTKGFFSQDKNKKPNGAIPLNWKRGTKFTKSEVKFDVKKILDARFDSKILPMDKIDDAIEAVKKGEENLFLIKGELSDKSRLASEKPAITIQMAGELGDDVIDLYCKIPPENVSSFTVPLYADMYAIGQIWKVGEGEETFTGMTAQAVYSDEVDVEAPPVDAETMKPTEGEGDW